MIGDEFSVLEQEGPLIWALDDEPHVIELLDSVLRDAGYRFEGFTREASLFTALARGSEHPELLVLDWMLADRSGHQVLKQWREAASEVPVIVLTALLGESVLINAFEGGARDLVRKPFEVTELLARIRMRIVEGRERVSTRALLEQLRQVLSLCHELALAEREVASWEVLHRGLVALDGQVRVALFRQDPQRGELRAMGSAQTLDVGAEPAMWSRLLAGEAVWCEAHGGLCELLLLSPGSEGVLLPILAEERLEGVALFSARQSEPLRAMAPHLKLALALFGALLGARGQDAREASAPSEALRRRWDELVRARVFLDRIIEASPDAIVAASRSGQMMLFNAAAERVLGWRREEALGQDVRRLYHPGEASTIMRRLRAEEEGGFGRLSATRTVLLARDGSEIPVELTAALLTDEDEVIGSVGLFKDLRAQLAISRQLERANQDLEAQRERAVMAELAGATAHELNQPLTSLLNYVEILGASPLVAQDARLLRAAQVIDREAERIAEIVKKIGQITSYRTRAYVGGARIVDIREEEEPEGP